MIRDGYGYEFGMFRSEELGIYVRAVFVSFLFHGARSPGIYTHGAVIVSFFSFHNHEI